MQAESSRTALISVLLATTSVVEVRSSTGFSMYGLQLGTPLGKFGPPLGYL